MPTGEEQGPVSFKKQGAAWANSTKVLFRASRTSSGQATLSTTNDDDDADDDDDNGARQSSPAPTTASQQQQQEEEQQTQDHEHEEQQQPAQAQRPAQPRCYDPNYT